MSEIRRVALHSAPRGRKDKDPPARSVRLNAELGASNEDQYPEISYRDLIAAHLKGKHKKDEENGDKKNALDAFSDEDADVARIASQFEKKYGGQSTYARKRTKRSVDEFADIGAGYDENDSFIDNTDGYDEMCPPGYDTFHGGFYINCGSLEFKNVREDDSDGPSVHRNNKRRISSSTEMDSSSDSSSESSCKDRPLNGDDNKDRRKQNKSEGKKKSKKMRTEDSAPTSGKHTSDDNAQSADSRTSHTEDSLTSKPAPSSENIVTSDSSRDVGEPPKPEKLPPIVNTVLEELSAHLARLKHENASPREVEQHTDHYLLSLERALVAGAATITHRKAAWLTASRVLGASRARLLQRARELARGAPSATAPPPAATQPAQPAIPSRVTETKPTERKEMDSGAQGELTEEEREKQIISILERLKTMIEAMKPGMIQTYKAECQRVQEENKRIAAANAVSDNGARLAERRLPKRRYPWCGRSRQLLGSLVRLCGGGQEAAARVLATRVLPLFPPGFVRLPTLLRQANLNKDLKIAELKKQRIPTPGHVVEDSNQPTVPPVQNLLPKPDTKTQEIACGNGEELKLNGKPTKSKSENAHSTFNSILNSFTLATGTDLFLEKSKSDPVEHKSIVTIEKVEAKFSPDKPKAETEKYVPPNSIGSITITPVSQPQKFDPRYQASKLANNTVTVSAKGPTESKIRVKSPAEIMKAVTAVPKDDKQKSKPEHKIPNTSIITKPPDKANERLHSQKLQDKPQNKLPQFPKSDKPHEPKLPNSLQIKPQDRLSPNPVNMKAQEKHIHSPLRIDTSQPKKDGVITHSPGFRQSNGEKADSLPRPGLVPVQHSPTFARPPDKTQQKQKDLIITTDLDPLSDVLQVDDSSSDVEVIEEATVKFVDPTTIVNKAQDPTTNAMAAQNTIPVVKTAQDATVVKKTNNSETDKIRQHENYKNHSHRTDDRAKDRPSEKRDHSKEHSHKHKQHSSRHEHPDRSEKNHKTDSRSEGRTDSSHRPHDSRERDRESTVLVQNKSHSERQERDRLPDKTAELDVRKAPRVDQIDDDQRRRLQKQAEVTDSDADIQKVLRDLRDLQNSQEPHVNSDSYNSVHG